MKSPYSHLPHSHHSLKVFEAVARSMSFTHAADELHVTQSAVSRQVKQLEEELGHTLVERLHRSIVLTEKGKELYEALQVNYKHLDGVIANWKQTDSNRIVIKASLSYATRSLIPKVHELHERYQDHEIVIVPTIDEKDALATQDYDVLIFSTLKKNDYLGEPGMTFLREEYMAPVYADSLASAKLSLQDMLKLPRLHATLDHFDWKTWLKDVAEAKGIETRNTTFFTLDLAMSACLSGQGVTVTDLLLVLPELERGFLQCPQGNRIQHSAWHYYVHCRNPSPATEDFIQWLKQETNNEKQQLRKLAETHNWQQI